VIKRDADGYICQHSNEDPNYLDGGDTAMRSGFAAICGMPEDRILLADFEITPGQLTRHPKQEPLNNPNNFTRDQLICWSAGSTTISRYNQAMRRVFWACIKRGFRAQNSEADYPGTTKKFPNGRDLLSPGDVYFLSVCAFGRGPGSWIFSILGLPWLLLTLFVSCKLNPKGEQNQLLCQGFVIGKWMTRLHYKLHPNLAKNLHDYWGGWRDQHELAYAAISKIWSQLGLK
jgi:hypothetical protein